MVRRWARRAAMSRGFRTSTAFGVRLRRGVGHGLTGFGGVSWEIGAEAVDLVGEQRDQQLVSVPALVRERRRALVAAAQRRGQELVLAADGAREHLQAGVVRIER